MTKGRLGKLAPMIRTLDTSVARPITFATNYGRNYGGGWKKLRDAVMKRDQYLCQPCFKQGLITEAKEVDHVKPQAEGGTDDMDNLQAICLDCHQAKTREEQKRGIARMQGR